MNTHEAEVFLPFTTKEGFSAKGLLDQFAKDVLNTFKEIDGHGHGSVRHHDITVTNLDNRDRAVLSSARVFTIRHHMKANAALKKLVEHYMALFGLESITYVNFSNEFETLPVCEDEEYKPVEVKNGKTANKK